jgi:predicted SAM-dependent methyltransferase
MNSISFVKKVKMIFNINHMVYFVNKLKKKSNSKKRIFRLVDFLQNYLYILQKNSYERGKTIQVTIGYIVNSMAGPCWVAHCGLTGSKSARSVS